MVAFVMTQVILIPILGGIWMGMRKEKQDMRRIFVLAVAASKRRF